jgi:PAS domain S-box-containing protein
VTDLDTLPPDPDDRTRALAALAVPNASPEAAFEDLDRLRGIADSLPVLIAYVDAEERYRFNNLAYEQWIGIPREEVTGRTLRDVLGEDLYGMIAGEIAAALSGETVNYERDLTWPDGTTRSVRGTYAPQHGPRGVEGFAVLVTDNTGHRQAEGERRLAAERHSALVAAQQEVAQAERDLDAVLTIITRRAQAMTGADGAVVEMAEGDDMVYRAASGGAAEHIGVRLRRETSLSGRCVAEGRLLVCEDTETDDRVDREACRRIGVRSMVVVPLTFLGRTIGVLKVYSALPHAFPISDLPLLEMMVSLAVAALSAVSEAEARTALSLSEQRLHALITSVPVILFALDADGVFTQSEGKGLEALGLTPGELVGRSYRDVYADEATLLDGMARGLSGETGEWLSEIGGQFFETQCLPLTDADGAHVGLIGVAFDGRSGYGPSVPCFSPPPASGSSCGTFWRR